MKRDFTQRVKTTLLDNIKQEEKREGIGDWYLFDAVADFLDIGEIQYSSTNALEYYNYIIDKNSATREKINTIWNEVYNIDQDTKQQFIAIQDLVKQLEKKLQQIYDIVGTGRIESSTIMSQNPNKFAAQFEEVDVSILEAKVVLETEKIKIRNEDGTVQYDWEVFKEIMQRNPTQVSTEEYYALIQIYREIAATNNLELLEKYFENSYIQTSEEIEYGSYVSGLANPFFNEEGSVKFANYKLSEVYNQVAELYSEIITVTLKQKIESENITIANLLVMCDADLTEDWIAFKEHISNELFYNNMLMSVKEGLGEVTCGLAGVDISIEQKVDSKKDKIIGCTSQSDSFYGDWVNENLVVLPGTVGEITVCDFKDALKIDVCTDDYNLKLVDSFRIEVGETAKEEVKEAIAGEVKGYITDMTVEGVVDSLVKESMQDIVTESIGKVLVVKDMAESLYETSIEAKQINTLLDNVENNTNGANIVQVFELCGNIAYVDDQLVIRNACIDSKKLGNALKDYNKMKNKTKDEELTVMMIQEYLEGELQNQEKVIDFYKWRTRK